MVIFHSYVKLPEDNSGDSRIPGIIPWAQSQLVQRPADGAPQGQVAGCIPTTPAKRCRLNVAMEKASCGKPMVKPMQNPCKAH